MPEVGVTFVVNVLDDEDFEKHVKAVVYWLDRHGYKAMPVNEQHILEAAEQIKNDMEKS